MVGIIDRWSCGGFGRYRLNTFTVAEFALKIRNSMKASFFYFIRYSIKNEVFSLPDTLPSGFSL